MNSKRKAELERILRRLDIIKIEIATVKDEEQRYFDSLADEDPCSDEVQDSRDAIENLEECLEYFEEMTYCLGLATWNYE